MRQLTVVLMLAVVAGFALTTFGEEGTKPSAVYGKVVSVNVDKGTIEVTVMAKGEETKATITTDAKTKITVDKKDATLADIKQGMLAVAKPATGTATEVSAFTPKETPKK